MYRRFVLATLCAASLACASDHASKTESTSAASTSMSASASSAKKSADAWNFDATIIEACSCPMFCQCYFNAKPAGPGCCAKPDDPKAAERYCRFNNAFKVNTGSYAGTSLDGAKFWLSGDLGGDFSKGTMGWCVLSFDPSV